MYELKVANELDVDRLKVSLDVYGSETDYQMTIPIIPLAKFGQHVSKYHEKNNAGFYNQYRVSGCGYLLGNKRALTLMCSKLVSGVQYRMSLYYGH